MSLYFRTAAQVAALGGDYQVVRIRVQRLPDEFLVGVRAVDVGGVEEGHSRPHHLLQNRDALVVVGIGPPNLRAGQLHRAIADPADGEVPADADGDR